MSDFLGLIRSRYGVVILSDSESDPNQNTSTYQINETCVASVFRGKDGVKNFLEKYVIPSDPKNLDEVIKITTSAFEQHYQDYVKENFSFFITGYENGQSTIRSFWFHEGKHKTQDITNFIYFVGHVEDLAAYLVTKVYSDHMSAEELKNLIVFVGLQCVKVFNLPSIFDLTIISKVGIKKLKSGEIEDIFDRQDHVDHKLKKILSDFFVKSSVIQ